MHHHSIGAFAQKKQALQSAGKGLQYPGNPQPESDAGDSGEIRDNRAIDKAGAPHGAVGQAAAVQDNGQL